MLMSLCTTPDKFLLFIVYCMLALCREIVTTYGLWDQLRIDKGKEWYLSIFINQNLSSHRYCTRKPPHLQTTSKKVGGMGGGGIAA